MTFTSVNYENIIIFIKYMNLSDDNVQSYDYKEDINTVKYLLKYINTMCYDNDVSDIAQNLYNILTLFLQKDINNESFVVYFDNLYGLEIMSQLQKTHLTFVDSKN